ncbi:hypothetical protein L2X99_12755 [Microbacterium sp. KUDC0406]|uniref:hypothetical protein n=1 Tax=Microbacterium sp. KUDC0406 TaxID=2909588 RepID=UPI001F1D2900|nr:hypothetical protein [Microbacterium sp. KUDC0406]UJP09299.1 hypothetical protein L2X99_12755 [Microbacterium sp. KUDC0406]
MRRSPRPPVSDDETAAELVEEAGRLSYLLDGLLADPLWADAASCLVAGPGTPAVVGALDDAGRDGLVLSGLDGGAVRRAVEDALEDPARAPVTTGPADVAVLALALEHRTDAECTRLLEEIAGRTTRAVVIEQARPDDLGGGADELRVLAQARSGAALRDGQAIAALGAASGWSSEREIELGWGMVATVLSRD